MYIVGHRILFNFSGRMVVECAFGHLARRFGVFEVLKTGEELTVMVVRTCIYLHNFIRLSRADEEQEIREKAKKNFVRVPIAPGPFGFSDKKEVAEINRHRLHLFFNMIDKSEF